MTAQISDKYTYKGDKYSIVAISNPINFHPKRFGLNPISICTSCWNGYWCEYDITEKGIFLEELFVHDANKKYPKINGRSVSIQDRLGHKHYKKIHEPIVYTGKILVGDRFLQQYYIHMGYQRAWAYEKLTEFVFENGRLIEINDYSEVAEKMRELLDSDKETLKQIYENPEKFVSESFSLKYKDKIWWA